MNPNKNMKEVIKMDKNKIRKLLEDAREENPFGWQLLEAGVFSYNGHLEGYITWKGQGMNEIVYNEKYDDIVDLTDLADTQEYDIDDAVDLAMGRLEYLEV